MMPSDQDIQDLQDRIDQFERKSRKTSWLLRQLGRKVVHFPRDLSRRLRRSKEKKQSRLRTETFVRNGTGAVAVAGTAAGTAAETPPSVAIPIIRKAYPFEIRKEKLKVFEELRHRDAAGEAALAEMSSFFRSSDMENLIGKAAKIDPEVGTMDDVQVSLCPPWHDADYSMLRYLSSRIPRGSYEAVILMPAGRMGGADLVAGILANALAKQYRTIVIRTDDAHWERPDWFPNNVPSVDLSVIAKMGGDSKKKLYVLLNEIGAKKIFNVNSKLAFETFATYGSRLATKFDLYAYYFCADRAPNGLEVGYPVWFFQNLLPCLRAAIIDTKDLADTLVARYAVPRALATKVHTIYTPAQLEIADPPMAVRAAESSNNKRPRIIWAGRLDRQKRFDLVTSIARAMGDVDFLCWGKAVLDAPPNVRHLPPNITLNPPFTSYDELPFDSTAGLLYTSAWDGLPTLLIEVGALGVPVVASAVGGVPELIDGSTGWPVGADAGVSDYVAAIREMLKDKDERVRRARALQERVRTNHARSTYAAAIASL